MNMKAKSSSLPIIILGALFFIFGFVTWLNGTLIPYLKLACELNNFQALLVAFAFYISYFVMALPASFVLKRTGLKKGMMLGLWIMAAGALLFIPAAETRTYALFLTGLFVIGTGLSLLQTASNPYVTIVGPIESAAARISIMGICNKIAGVLAPIVLGALVLADADSLTNELGALAADEKMLRLDELASRVKIPYAVMAGLLVLLGFLVRISPLPELEQQTADSGEAGSAGRTSVWQFPALVLGVISLFLYVGVEVIAGDTIGNYGQSLGIPLSEAKNFTSFTLTAMVASYIIGIVLIPKYLSQEKALAYSAVSGLIFSAGVLALDGYASVLCVALLGLSNALMWPAIWPLSINGLGKFMNTGSALLIMAIAGGATLPLLYGWLADLPSLGPQMAYLVMFPCYLFILYFSLKGHKIKTW